jgi:hypothetical protein
MAWDNQAVPAVADQLDSLTCSSSTHCVAVGQNSDAGFAPVILTTPDAGNTWTSQSVPWTSGVAENVVCPSLSDCIAVGFVAGGAGVIAATTDGGYTWDLQSYPVDGSTQTITFTSAAPTHATVGGPTYTVTAVGGGSGNPVTFSTSGGFPTPVCSLSGSVISFGAAGTCFIDAEQKGDSNYGPAPNAQQSFVVSPSPTAPTIRSFRPDKGKIGRKVTLSGTRMSDATTVTLDGTQAPIVHDSAKKLTITVPVGAHSGYIEVSTSGGSVMSTKTFTVK